MNDLDKIRMLIWFVAVENVVLIVGVGLLLHKLDRNNFKTDRLWRIFKQLYGIQGPQSSPNESEGNDQ
jgi:hypothetical protein